MTPHLLLARSVHPCATTGVAGDARRAPVVQMAGDKQQCRSIARVCHPEAVVVSPVARPRRSRAGRTYPWLNGAPTLVAIAVALCAAVDARAQQLVVTVRDSLARTPVAAAIVTATDQANGTRVYALTNTDGRAAIRLPNAGTWTASVRRIGIVPKAGAVVVVEQGDIARITLDAANLRFTLPRVRVTAKAGVCGRAPSGIDRTSALWEQVTLALRSSALARGDSSQSPRLRVRLYERARDLDLTLVWSTVVKTGEGTKRPFFAADPDSLARFGYVRSDPGGMIAYYAPDEIVMLSDAFVRTHCFGTPLVDANPALAELEFKPAPRQRVPDVAGVAYVDTVTGELRRIVFRYVNGSELIPKGATRSGGEVVLRRLEDGQWIVTDWTIRMPDLLKVEWQKRRTLVGYREHGGATITDDDAILDSLELVAVLSVRDSLARLRASRDTSQVVTSADTSIRAFARTVLLSGRRIYFISARKVEARMHFARYRAEGGGFFLDSAAIAETGTKTVHELLMAAPGMLAFRVPADVDTPGRNQDVLLAREWRSGTTLPMMRTRSSTTDASGGALCFPRTYLDYRAVPLSITEQQQLRAVQIATVQIYPPDTDAPLKRRFGDHLDVEFFGNKCGLIHMQSYVDYPFRP